MAIDRLVSLAIIALVAIIFPIMGQLLAERVPTDDELLTYLSYEGPSSADFEPALKSITAKDQVRIGPFTVTSLLHAKDKGWHFEKDCEYVTFPERSDEIEESDLTLVLNVFNVVNDHNEEWKKSCAENIKNNFAKIQQTTKIRSNRPSDDELVTKLREKSLLAWEIKIILQAIRDKSLIIIGGYSVRYFLELEERGHAGESHCQSFSFMNGPEGMKDSDLTLALNVFNFVNHRDENLKEFCAEIIERNFRLIEIIGSHHFDDNQLIAKLREGELEVLDVSIILNAIRDKNVIIIFGYSVGQLLEMEKHGIHVDLQCMLLRFPESIKEIQDSDLILALNVFNFVHYRDPRMNKSCADNIKANFASAKLAAVLDAKVLTNAEIKDLTDPIEDKEGVKILELTLSEILEDASKDTSTIPDCVGDEFLPRSDLEGGQNLVTNIHNFIHFERLVSFCAENFRTVLDWALPDTDKQLIRDFKGERNYPVRKSRSRDRLDPCGTVRLHWEYIENLMIRPESKQHRESLEEIKSELAEMKDLCESK